MPLPRACSPCSWERRWGRWHCGSARTTLKLIPYAMTTSNPVTGLKLEAPVRYRGVDVGKVDAIAIDAANGGRVRIRYRRARGGTPITRSTYAQLGYQGITGLAYVLLGDDGKSQEPLRSGPRRSRSFA